MKCNEPVIHDIGEARFYIYPFPAMKAANVTGDLMAVVVPLISGFAPLFVGKTGVSVSNILDVDVTEHAPLIAQSFSAINGDKLESLLRKMLLAGNITVDIMDDYGEKKVVRMDEDVMNSVFCGETQDMFLLAFRVMQVNFSGFFKKLGAQSGGVTEKLIQAIVNSTATSTAASSAI